MTDADAAQIVLRWFYDNPDKMGWGESLRLTPEVFDGQFGIEQLHRVVARLKEDGLISASCSNAGPMFNPDYPIQPLAIKRAGIDAIELAAPMTQTEKLKAVLRACLSPAVNNSAEMEGDTFENAEEAQAMFIFARDRGLIEGEVTAGFGFAVIGITPEGRAVLSGEGRNPFDPQPPPASQTFHISGPVTGSQFGPGSTMNNNVNVHLQALAQAVMDAEGMPTASKRTALERLHALASDGTIGNAAGVGSLIVSLLDNLPSG